MFQRGRPPSMVVPGEEDTGDVGYEGSRGGYREGEW